MPGVDFGVDFEVQGVDFELQGVGFELQGVVCGLPNNDPWHRIMTPIMTPGPLEWTLCIICLQQ